MVFPFSCHGEGEFGGDFEWVNQTTYCKKEVIKRHFTVTHGIRFICHSGKQVYITDIARVQLQG